MRDFLQLAVLEAEAEEDGAVVEGEARTEESSRRLSAIIRGTNVTQVYSPSGANAMCAEYGLKAGSSVDFTNGWEFNLEEHRGAARSRVKEECPALIIGSPLWTMFFNSPEHEPDTRAGEREGEGGVP